MTEYSLTDLRCGATGQPAITSPDDQLAQLRHQQKTIGWHAATPYVLDAAQAYREVMGSRREREQATDRPTSKPSSNTFLK